MAFVAFFAVEIPLILFDCDYEGINWIYEEGKFMKIIKYTWLQQPSNDSYKVCLLCLLRLPPMFV